MPLFPMFLDMKGKQCLVYGGGLVALRKVRTLLKFGLSIQICAREYVPELLALAEQGQIKIIEEGQPAASDLVICATSDALFNHQIAEQCKALDIPVNSATGDDDSTFIFPAVVTRGDLVVGVSSSGQVPAMTKRVRQEIEATLPDWYSVLLGRLADLRERVMGELPTQKAREAFLSQVTAYGLEHEGNIPDSYVTEVLEDIHAR